MSVLDEATPAEWDAATKKTLENIYGVNEEKVKYCRDFGETRKTQVGGTHYIKEGGIQPIEFITSNEIPFREANVIKYVFRHTNKNGVEDLLKARDYIDMLINDYKTKQEK